MTCLLWDKNKEAIGLEFGELVTEAANLFNAAGENTEIALTAVVFCLTQNPHIATKLREELDQAFRERNVSTAIPPYDAIKDLPYLRACIDEGMRLFPSLPGGLPCVVSPNGMRVSGEWLEGGTTISVSTHTVHRESSIFQDEPEAYMPDRWLKPNATERQRGFLAFSQGGRACLGRNIAYVNMQLVIATLFQRYDFQLLKPEWQLDVIETLSGHTGPLPVRISRRT